MRNVRALIAIAAALVLPLAACTDAEDVMRPELGDPAVALSGSENGVGNAADAATRLYWVTVENMTTGQPFSPGVIATHTKDQSAFRVGYAASEGIRMIAETGNPSVAVAALSGAPGVHEAKAFPYPLAPIHRIGGPGPNYGSIQIEAAANANRLSLAIMLICTNDGFTGLESVKLPGGFQPMTYYAKGYDAGTEVNNELSTSIVDPCGGAGPIPLPMDGDSRTAEGGVIMHHLSVGSHGWSDPVAKITVQRVE
jgi:hypothetical protein